MAAKGLKFEGIKNMKTTSKIALGILVVVALLSIFAPLIAPNDPYSIGMARQAPDAAHIFGTDDKGRDILSRMLYGGRISLLIGFGATGFALITGSIVGAAAAVSRKSISEVIMRILDIIMSVPGIAPVSASISAAIVYFPCLFCRPSVRMTSESRLSIPRTSDNLFPSS
jgi:peptide/nickel transport system permease protein